LILEDDAVICNHAAEILAKLETSNKYDLISLEVRRRKKFLSKEGEPLAQGYSLHDMLYDKGGAAGYIVWPEGARKLLNHMEQYGAAPADAFLGDCKNLERGQVVPAPIIQLDMCEHYRVKQFSSGLSTIFTNIPRPGYGSLVDYLKFKTRRSVGQLDLLFRVQLAGNLSSRYKEVEVTIENADFVS
jgi:glycosyl transferase family 25